MTPPHASRTLRVLVLNAGSTSLRFALLRADEALTRVAGGQVKGLGADGAHLVFDDDDTPIALARHDADGALAGLVQALRQRAPGAIDAVGHRVVHGLERTEPSRVTPALLDELHAVAAIDPDHLPAELRLMRASLKHLPDVPQVACFDTHFHRTLPREATLLPLPRRFAEAGVRRFGFHGLSYEYLVEHLTARGWLQGRMVLAHLGGGASLAAVHRGRSVDTTMAFTPAAGLVMGTRSGDLDPGLPAYLARRFGTTPAQFDRIVNHESGLLGLSGTSGDMQALLAAEAHDRAAAEAVNVFCRGVAKGIGAMAVVLGRLDGLVFAGGIGEAAPVVRARICANLGVLGVELDPARNAAGDESIGAGVTPVHVIKTDEARVIARHVRDLLPRETRR